MKKLVMCWIAGMITAMTFTGCGKLNPPPTVPAVPAALGPQYSLGATFVTNVGNVLGVAPTGDHFWFVNAAAQLQEWTTAGSPLTVITTFNGGDTFHTNPHNVSVGPDGYVYVADTYNNRVVVFDPTGVYVTTFAKAEFGSDLVNDVRVDQDYVYVQDGTTPQFYIYVIGGAGSTKTFTSYGGRGFFTLGSYLNVIFFMCLDNNGNVYASNWNTKNIDVYSPGGFYERSVTCTGFETIQSATVDTSGNIFVADPPNTKILEVTAAGAPVTSWGNSAFIKPDFLNLDASGNLYVTDDSAQEIFFYKKNY